MIKWGIGVLALAVTFSHTPSSVDQNQEFNADVSVSCTSCNDSYLRGVFYPSGTNYFGFTKNNSGSWINSPGSQATQYFLVTKDNFLTGTWSGQLTFKPDPADSAFTGPGNYFFKVGRYTASGSVTWSDPVTLAISGPAPAPTSLPTSVPTHTPRPLPTLAPTPAPTLPPATPDVPAPLTPSPTPAPLSSSPIPPTPVPTVLPQSSNSQWPSIAFLASGSAFLGTGTFFLLRHFIPSSN